MPRLKNVRVDKMAPDKINTDLLLEELKSKIALAEYEHKATFEKSEFEKKTNFHNLTTERRKNKVRRSSMFSNCPQSLVNVPDGKNISTAFEDRQRAEKLCVVRKKMPSAIEIQDRRLCESIKKYNLKVYEKSKKQEEVKNLQEELQLLKKTDERMKLDELNSPEAQKMRVLENAIEKLKMKLSSGVLISRYYNKIIDNLKKDTQDYPWKLDLLETEVSEHHRALEEAITIKQESQSIMEKSIHDTKEFHEEYFESKKNRDKMLINTRKDVDKAHHEVKGKEWDKPKQVRPQIMPNPQQEALASREDDDAQFIQMKYEQQRKKRLDYESTASLLKNACKVSSKEEILPAITQQHEVQRALKLQMESLENQKTVLEIEKAGVNKEYRNLKYCGEQQISDSERLVERDTALVNELTQQLVDTTAEIKAKQTLLEDIEIGCNNFFMMLQKYKIDPQAKSLMTGELETDFSLLSEKFEQLVEQISTRYRVSDYLENSEFLDYMEDTLPGNNTKVEVRGDEEEHADVFDDEGATKQTASVMGREDIKRAAQKIIEKNQGKLRRKKKK